MNGAHFERDWADSLMRQPRTGPERSLVVSGVYDRWIEPRGRSYARLELEIQPADQFEVAASPTAALDRVHELFGPEWLMYVGFGFLDVSMTEPVSPVTLLRLDVLAAEIDPVGSSLMSFRLAGRNAARVVLQSGVSLRVRPHRQRVERQDDKATWGGYLAYVRLADELWTAGERLWASGIFTAIASGSTGGEVKDALRMQLQQLGRSVAAERLGLCERIDILQRALSANLQ